MSLARNNGTDLAPEHAQARTVRVHRLVRKFVDSAQSVPDDAKDVLYYTLSVGHHTGVIDCFECVLSMPVEIFERICAALPEGEARYKLEGVMRHSEIELGKAQVDIVIDALEPLASAADEEVARYVGLFLEQLRIVREEPSVYAMVREVVS